MAKSKKDKSEESAEAESQLPETSLAPSGLESSLFAFADELAGDGAVESQEPQEGAESWVSFLVADSLYGLKVEAVREVLRVEMITAVPHTPAHVRGVTNMRGRVLPVVDLRLRLGFERGAVSEASRILVVRHGSEPVGILVDAVRQMLQVLPSTVGEPPADSSPESQRAVIGMVPLDSGVLLLLDPKALL